MATMKELMADFQKRYEEAITSHEKLIAESHARYEKTLSDATNQFQGMMAKLQAGEQELENKPDQRKPEDIPQAVWIKAPTLDGQSEEMMVLNQPAVIMFMAIFQRMSEISEELKKLTGRRAR